MSCRKPARGWKRWPRSIAVKIVSPHDRLRSIETNVAGRSADLAGYRRFGLYRVALAGSVAQAESAGDRARQFLHGVPAQSRASQVVGRTGGMGTIPAPRRRFAGR